MSRLIITLAAGITALAGCKSIESTLLHRDESNLEWKKVKTSGVPITLEVPTHLRIAIMDVKYAHAIGGVWSVLKDGKNAVNNTHVEHGFIKTKKVFTVDLKRPAAGDADYQIDMAEGSQYIKKIEHDITDRTIEESSMAFERLFAAFNVKGAGGSALRLGPTDNPLEELKSVRAVRVFEIDDPNFENNVAAFLSEHFDCETAGFVPAPTAMKSRKNGTLARKASINRVR